MSNEKIIRTRIYLYAVARFVSGGSSFSIWPFLKTPNSVYIGLVDSQYDLKVVEKGLSVPKELRESIVQ